MTRRQNIWMAMFIVLSCCFVDVATAAVDHSESSVQHSAPRAHEGPTHPNIIFILTDDMALRDLEFMPKLKKFLIEEGTTFSNYFVTNSQCCPSRSSILRGQYVHNHGVESNSAGFRRFYQLGNESSTMATWLKAAGYMTGYMGKYLNGYPTGSSKTHVPPGWDEWHGAIGGAGYNQFDYSLNENGKIVAYGRADADYLTDVISRKTTAFIHQVIDKKKPFFLHLAPFAPHEPAIPAPRHRTLFADAKAPRSASFNAKDVGSKPADIALYRFCSQNRSTKWINFIAGDCARCKPSMR